MLSDFLYNKLYLIILIITMMFIDKFSDFHILEIGNLGNLRRLDYWDEATEDLDEEEKKFFLTDFIKALSMKSFEWAFCIHIPIVFIILKYNIPIDWWVFAFSIAINSIIHLIADNKLVNTFKINLSSYSTTTTIQTVVTGILWLLLFKRYL